MVTTKELLDRYHEACDACEKYLSQLYKERMLGVEAILTQYRMREVVDTLRAKGYVTKRVDSIINLVNGEEGFA